MRESRRGAPHAATPTTLTLFLSITGADSAELSYTKT